MIYQIQVSKFPSFWWDYAVSIWVFYLMGINSISWPLLTFYAVMGWKALKKLDVSSPTSDTWCT